LSPTLLILGLLACVLVPLPTVVVDVCLSLSLALGVLLLVAALKVPRSTEFLSFPSMLLLATLFRLALNISTTRLILSQADAGRVVDAFAHFVVRGDLIIGAVMFAIITTVQYLVIAKGAERVAEVGARFALDGMPGHQAAIDADLRAGVISAGEASQQRARLGERSRFYGAMDGAIRFVKGDAVAGIVITVINLLGGLSVGMGRRGMDLESSLELYGTLAVGDGLLAQIPALLVSLAAGILVSRVDSEGKTQERYPWLQPGMLLVPALFLAVLAAVPGMPYLAFGTMAVAWMAAAVGLARRVSSSPDESPRVTQITIFVGGAAFAERRLQATLAALRERCAEALGIEVPPLVLGSAPQGVSVVDDRGALGDRRTIEIRFGKRLFSRSTIEGDVEEGLLLAGYRAVVNHAEDLVDLQHVDREIENLRVHKSAIVRRALEHAAPEDVLAVVRMFLRERIPVPPMESILGVLAEGKPKSVERLRVALADFWLGDLLDGLARLGPLRCLRPTPDLEESLLETFRESGEERWGEPLQVALGRRQRAAWILALTRAHSLDLEEPGGPMWLLTTARARPAFAALLRGHQPHVPVISTEEFDGAGLAIHASALPESAYWVDSTVDFEEE